MPDVTPDNAPPLSEVPLLSRYEIPSVTHTARARAALASSPTRPATLSVSPDGAAHSPASPSSPRRTR
ncbi:hypothetical protein [Streptomyces sp. NPDC050263]|uniref:hypothetical protein n=1 Tax=Streptomyces sp. NPDC050263 TaxID=3155037 RepID=UPI0034433F19